MLLTQVELIRFKAFDNSRIRAAPITVLIGPNNAGKSTVLQSLALLAQTVSASTLGPVRTVGPIVDLGATVADLTNDASDAGATWLVKLAWKAAADSSTNNDPVEFGFDLQAGSQAGPQNFTTAAWARQELPRGRTVEARVTWGTSQPQQLTVKAKELRTGISSAPPIDRQVQVNAISPWQWQVMQPVDRPSDVDVANGEPDAVVAALLLTAMPFLSGGIAQQLQAFHYVASDRQIVRSVYPLGGNVSGNPQTAEDVINTLAFSDDILARVSERLLRTFEYGIDKTLVRSQQFGPTDRGNQVGLVATRANARRRNVVNMGAGFTQFGWIALQLELARIPPPNYFADTPLPTPLVGIEEPELHLHPRLQLAVARLLAEFAQQEGQVICTTQSEHFLLAILELVLDGTLSHDQVAVYYLQAPLVEPLEVDAKGRLKGGLRGFLETNEERVKRQIDLLRKSAGLDS